VSDNQKPASPGAIPRGAPQIPNQFAPSSDNQAPLQNPSGLNGATKDVLQQFAANLGFAPVMPNSFQTQAQQFQAALGRTPHGAPDPTPRRYDAFPLPPSDQGNIYDRALPAYDPNRSFQEAHGLPQSFNIPLNMLNANPPILPRSTGSTTIDLTTDTTAPFNPAPFSDVQVRGGRQSVKSRGDRVPRDVFAEGSGYRQKKFAQTRQARALDIEIADAEAKILDGIRQQRDILDNMEQRAADAESTDEEAKNRLLAALVARANQGFTGDPLDAQIGGLQATILQNAQLQYEIRIAEAEAKIRQNQSDQDQIYAKVIDSYDTVGARAYQEYLNSTNKGKSTVAQNTPYDPNDPYDTPGARSWVEFIQSVPQNKVHSDYVHQRTRAPKYSKERPHPKDWDVEKNSEKHKRKSHKEREKEATQKRNAPHGSNDKVLIEGSDAQKLREARRQAKLALVADDDKAREEHRRQQRELYDTITRERQAAEHQARLDEVETRLAAASAAAREAAERTGTGGNSRASAIIVEDAAILAQENAAIGSILDEKFRSDLLRKLNVQMNNYEVDLFAYDDDEFQQVYGQTKQSIQNVVNEINSFLLSDPTIEETKEVAQGIENYKQGATNLPPMLEILRNRANFRSLTDPRNTTFQEHFDALEAERLVREQLQQEQRGANLRSNNDVATTRDNGDLSINAPHDPTLVSTHTPESHPQEPVPMQAYHGGHTMKYWVNRIETTDDEKKLRELYAKIQERDVPLPTAQAEILKAKLDNFDDNIAARNLRLEEQKRLYQEYASAKFHGTPLTRQEVLDQGKQVMINSKAEGKGPSAPKTGVGLGHMNRSKPKTKKQESMMTDEQKQVMDSLRSYNKGMGDKLQEKKAASLQNGPAPNSSAMPDPKGVTVTMKSIRFADTGGTLDQNQKSLGTLSDQAASKSLAKTGHMEQDLTKPHEPIAENKAPNVK